MCPRCHPHAVSTGTIGHTSAEARADASTLLSTAERLLEDTEPILSPERDQRPGPDRRDTERSGPWREGESC